MLRRVADDFAASGGVADDDEVGEVQVLDQLREIAGVGVHVVAGIRLGRAAVTTAVVGDRAVPVVGDELDLDLPGI